MLLYIDKCIFAGQPAMFDILKEEGRQYVENWVSLSVSEILFYLTIDN